MQQGLSTNTNTVRVIVQVLTRQSCCLSVATTVSIRSANRLPASLRVPKHPSPQHLGPQGSLATVVRRLHPGSQEGRVNANAEKFIRIYLVKRGFRGASGKWRIPDEYIPHLRITEFKSVKNLRWTRQIDDYFRKAKREGITFEIVYDLTAAREIRIDKRFIEARDKGLLVLTAVPGIPR